MAASSKEKAKSTLYGLISKQELLKQCQDILKSPINSPGKSVEGFLFLIRNTDFSWQTCLTINEFKSIGSRTAGGVSIRHKDVRPFCMNSGFRHQDHHPIHLLPAFWADWGIALSYQLSFLF